VVTKVKMFVADEVIPATPVTGTSLEEQINVYLSTLTNANVLEVVVSLSKSGKYGQNPVYVACVVYKG
jgi:hypothetical protein